MRTLEQKREYARKWRASNLKHKREYLRKWRAANPERSRELSRKWRDANPERQRESTRKRKAANREKVYEHNRKWCTANPEKIRDGKRKYRAINPEVERKGTRKHRGTLNPSGDSRRGLCPICLHIKPLVSDHNHVSGVMRGWLCSPCNAHIEHPYFAKWQARNKERIDEYLWLGAYSRLMDFGDTTLSLEQIIRREYQ